MLRSDREQVHGDFRRDVDSLAPVGGWFANVIIPLFAAISWAAIVGLLALAFAVLVRT